MRLSSPTVVSSNFRESIVIQYLNWACKGLKLLELNLLVHTCLLKLFYERFKSSSLILLLRTDSLFDMIVLPIFVIARLDYYKKTCLGLNVCLKWRSAHSRCGHWVLTSLCKSTACLNKRSSSEVALFRFNCILTKDSISLGAPWSRARTFAWRPGGPGSNPVYSQSFSQTNRLKLNSNTTRQNGDRGKRSDVIPHDVII